jgi:molybdopterin-guanine dinucleotide biosynthesis protein A
VTIPSAGGIVLCGGPSQRMGRPKAWLPIGSGTFLTRIVRTMSDVLNPIIVVAGREQDLPDLPAHVTIVRDERDFAGPLAGLAVGLRAMQSQVDRVFVTGVDTPFVSASFIRRVVMFLDDPKLDVAVPKIEDQFHPLAAAYRASILSKIESELDGGQRSIRAALAKWNVRDLNRDDLIDADPRLQSLININTPEDYKRFVLVPDALIDDP